MTHTRTGDMARRHEEVKPDECQGFLFSKPLPTDEFAEKYLRALARTGT